jgi:hypothetical protein
MTYRRIKVSSLSWPSDAKNFVPVVHGSEVAVGNYIPVDTAGLSQEHRCDSLKNSQVALLSGSPPLAAPLCPLF